jgi:hypothetical protein
MKIHEGKSLVNFCVFVFFVVTWFAFDVLA